MNTTTLLILCLSTCLVTLVIALVSYWRLSRNHTSLTQLQTQLLSQSQHQEIRLQASESLQLKQQEGLSQQQLNMEQRQLAHFQQLQESQSNSVLQLRQQIQETLHQHSELLGKRVDKLTDETRRRLQDISQSVESRLNEGFEKTNATFTDVVKRLALIDEAQKKITELSSSVVSLQDILNDKRSRGAFGEVQLSALVRNMIPESQLAFQHTLSTGKRCDCILFLPEPTGNVAIDAKFPLETYQKLQNLEHTPERKTLEAQFRKDIKKHIQDIAEKYIIPGETADGAILFIPAEAIFAEIHSHFPDLIELAHKLRVWLVSPTTLMAILSTARSVLKDAATKKQIHIIREHLHHLSQDFSRFQDRMDKLAKHISQAHNDVEQVNTSAKKISQRFTKIENVDLQLDENPKPAELGLDGI